MNRGKGRSGRLALAILVVSGSLIAAGLTGGIGLGGASVTLAQYQYAGGKAVNLKLTIVADTKGPLTSCPASATGCTVFYYLYVDNKNTISATGSHATRATLPGSFVMTNVDMQVLVNGTLYSDILNTPPPNVSVIRAWSAHWPSTVRCANVGDPSQPCNVVESPAIVPGETAVAFYAGWAHNGGAPDFEPNGTYVFRFAIHGTVDGTPVELSADSAPITMN